VPERTHQIFVSYSHLDAALVIPIVRLLRATKGWVFLDSDSIQPGKKWRGQIDEALRTATLVVVFWCRHSNESSDVEQEYQSALIAQKDVLPVLLDSTELPPALGAFQWIDFRQLAGQMHDDSIEEDIPDEQIDKARAHAALGGPRALARTAIVLLAAVIVSALLFGVYSTGKGGSPGPPIDAAPGSPSSLIVVWTLLTAIVVVSVIYRLVRRWSTRGSREPREARGHEPLEVARDLANRERMTDALREEIRHRLNVGVNAED
jgi:hypothetical protein